MNDAIHKVAPLLIALLILPLILSSGSSLTTVVNTDNTVAPVISEDRVLIEELKAVKINLQSSEFQKAITRLKDLENMFRAQPVSDLILYWKGSALMAISIEEAVDTFETLLRRCSQKDIDCAPAILRKARLSLIELRLLNNRTSARYELEGYLRDYPDDDYALYLLSYLYKEEGMDSSSLYKRLYIKNSNYIKFIKDEIGVMSLNYEEFEQKVKDLIFRAKYEEAEQLIKLRLDIEKSPGNRESLRRLLGNIYFRQKRYFLAAEQFLASKEYYLLSLSYLRCGLDEEAQKVLQKLIRSKDRRSVPIAIAYARNLRDKGNTDAAIQYLQELLRIFPLDAERIYWAIAWTHYRTGNYDEALKVLQLLNSRYKDIRYEYWLLRTEEKVGLRDNSERFRILAEQESGIYSLMAKTRLRTEEALKTLPPSVLRSLAPSPSLYNLQLHGSLFRRVLIFTELGLKDEATQEISAYVNRCLQEKGYPAEVIRVSGGVEDKEAVNCNELLAGAGVFYFKTGQYHRAVSLFSRLKSIPSLKDRVDDSMLYPLAFIESVEDAAMKYEIDPFLLLAIMREESRYNPEAISPAGAIGLLQIMPYTARKLLKEALVAPVVAEVKVEEGNSQVNDIGLMDSQLNIQLGARYLKGLLQRYREIPYVVAAYNAGERAVDSWLKNNYSSIDEFIEDIPYGETINYVKRVLTTYDRYLRIYQVR